MRNKAERLAALHQLSAAEEAGNARYGMNVPYAIALAIKDHTVGHQHWAERYAAYAREQLGISETDQLFA